MPLKCYLCNGDKANHHFPKTASRLLLWMKSLQLDIEPPDYARVCSDHFLPSDFYDRGGRKYLVNHAIPSLSLKCKSYMADHNYALGMVYQEESYPPEIFIVAAFGLLLLFDFFLSFSLQQPEPSYPEGKNIDT